MEAVRRRAFASFIEDPAAEAVATPAIRPKPLSNASGRSRSAAFTRARPMRSKDSFRLLSLRVLSKQINAVCPDSLLGEGRHARVVKVCHSADSSSSDDVRFVSRCGFLLKCHGVCFGGIVRPVRPISHQPLSQRRKEFARRHAMEHVAVYLRGDSEHQPS